jgi:hypothetical protein
MKRHFITLPPGQESTRRRGAVFVLAALAMVLIFGLTAFTVDVGFITMSKGQLQNVADASALAGLIELGDGLGPGATLTAAQVSDAAAQAAVATAAANRAAELTSVYCDPARDVRVGNYSFDSISGTWVKQWNVTPYNMIEVSLHRDQAGSTIGDGPLDLFFAPVMGTDDASLTVVSTAVLQPGVGIGGNSDGGDQDGFIGILPITLDEPTWDNLVYNGVGTDNYSYNPVTGEVTDGPDGIKEVNLYPTNAAGLPGNRGTVDFGHTGNSTADISRQILYGLSEEDLEIFDQPLNFENGPFNVNGDTGLSAGIKDELEAIKGEPRTIPIFDDAWGNGNNAYYRIVKFVGIRIMNVKLTGNPKRVIIQPTPIIADEVIPGDVVIGPDTIFTPGAIIP